MPDIDITKSLSLTSWEWETLVRTLRRYETTTTSESVTMRRILRKITRKEEDRGEEENEDEEG